MDESDLIDLNAFLLLERLLDHEDLVVRLKIEGLFSTSQGFYENL